jgi:hypothetical protein
MLFIVFSRLVVLAGNASSLRQRETCGYRVTPRLDPGAEKESLRVSRRGPGRVSAAAGGPRRLSVDISRRPPDRAATATGSLRGAAAPSGGTTRSSRTGRRGGPVYARPDLAYLDDVVSDECGPAADLTRVRRR